MKGNSRDRNGRSLDPYRARWSIACFLPSLPKLPTTLGYDVNEIRGKK